MALPEIAQRLSHRLDLAEPSLVRLDRYHRGEQPLAFASEKFREAFGSALGALSDNFLGLVISSVSERLEVQGFRFDSEAADADAWQTWQANNLDNDAQLLHDCALLYGRAYAMVWADADGAPVVSVESPRTTAVAHVPGSRRTLLAALKRYVDEEGYGRAFLYLPDEIRVYRSTRTVASWDTYTGTERGAFTSPVEWQTVETYPNPLGRVPIVPFTNRPSIDGTDGESELAQLLGITDAINKLVADLLIASEYSAFRQRWATGLEIPTSPDTGQPVEPFDSAVSRLWVAESPEAKFGAFDSSDLSNYTGALRSLIEHLVARSGIPAHYVWGASGQFPSGDALRSAEASLVAKVRQRQRWWGESWEAVMRLAFAVADDPRAQATDAETIWRDPENRTEAQHVDALTKLATLGVPQDQLLSDAGYSPQAIERFRTMRRTAAADQVALNLQGVV